MKTRFFSALATAAVLFTNTIFANNIENLYDLGGTSLTISTIKSEKSVIVNATNTNDQDITVAIEDANGAVVFKEQTNQGRQFAKKYNLSKLDAGDYRVIVTKNYFKTIQPITLTHGTIEMSVSERKEKFLPNVTVKDMKMDVNVLLGNYNNVHVSVYANTGEKVFEERDYVVLNLHKRYNLENLKKGIYLVEVTAGDETKTFTIEL
jgi:hypothetical protein